MPVTIQYAHRNEVHIAYQVIGEGARIWSTFPVSGRTRSTLGGILVSSGWRDHGDIEANSTYFDPGRHYLLVYEPDQ